MKKTYKAPAIELYQMFAEQMVAASIRTVEGDSGITLGDEDDAPDQADVKGNYFGESLFD